MPTQPVAPVPLATPVAIPTVAVPTAVPTAVPNAAPDPALNFTSQPELTIAPTPLLGKHRHGNWAARWRLPIVLALSLLLAGGLLFFIVKHAGRPAKEVPPAGDARKFEDLNFSLRPPEKRWKADVDLPTGLKARLAYSRADPADHLAIEVIDFKEREPRRGVWLDEALERLRGYFGEDVAWQPKAPATLEKFEPCYKLAGQPALVLEFEGNHDSVLHIGECAMMHYRGRVYLFFTFAPSASDEQRKALQEEWAGLRERFGVLNQREGWKPQAPPSEPFQGDGYTLAFAKEVWKKADLGDFDKQSVLALEGHDPKEDRDGEASRAGKAAYLRVAVLAAKADVKPADAARQHVIARQMDLLGLSKPEELELVAVQGRKGEKLEGPADIGAFKNGYLSKNRMRVPAGTLDRFVVVAAVPLKERLLVVYSECDWKRRDYWEQEINALLDTFKRAK
jgi:hypothetical protein